MQDDIDTLEKDDGDDGRAVLTDLLAAYHAVINVDGEGIEGALQITGA